MYLYPFSLFPHDHRCPINVLFSLPDFAEALSNPLAWLSEQERHQRQLEVFDEENEDQTVSYL